MSTLKGVNVTKYDAGGSGDNYIADGLIKTVEKIWTDSYTVTAAVTTADVIKIAKIPKGKKLTSVEIFVPVMGTVTNSTINLGNGDAQDATFGTLATWDTTATREVSLSDLAGTGMAYEMTADTDISISFSPATTITAGTIKTVVRYT